MMPEKISISLGNILSVIVVGLLLVLFWQLRSLLVVLMIAVVIAATLAPAIARAEKLGIPRWLSVISVYLSLIAIITGLCLLIGPTVIEQIERLIRRLPDYLEVLRSLVNNLILRLEIANPDSADAGMLDQLLDINGLSSWVISSSQELVVRSYSVTKGIIGSVFSLLLALLLSGYMLGASEKLLQDIINLFPFPWNSRLSLQIHPVTQRMGGYIQGRILVSAILALAISLGLNFVGLADFALGLGVIAGFTNLIPFFGPVLGSIPALIVAIAQGGWTTLWVLLLFLIIQNIETYLLDPLLVGNSVKVHPLYQLLAVLGGAQVLGIVGALIVPPWLAGGAVLLENLYLKPKLVAEANKTASL
jgi:predicted PurR-regulated permease PerM